MLDHRREPEIAQWIDSWPCYLKPPDELSPLLERSGPAPTQPDDGRQQRRLRCGSIYYRAAMRCAQSLPAIAREAHWYVVYITDIAKCGCGFLHFEQLYPGERCELVLGNGIRVAAEVRWCRRIDENCFAVGSEFIDAQSGATPVS